MKVYTYRYIYIYLILTGKIFTKTKRKKERNKELHTCIYKIFSIFFSPLYLLISHPWIV